MIRKLTAARKETRKEKNYAAVKPIYDRGGMSLPAETLVCHQSSDPQRVGKIKAKAERRRRQRAEKLLAAAGNWRALVQPNWPGNMTPHERELAEAVDEIDGKVRDIHNVDTVSPR